MIKKIIRKLPVLDKRLFMLQVSQKRPRRTENIETRVVGFVVAGEVHHGGNKEENHRIDVNKHENV